MLPLEVLETARDELIDWHHGGMSVMEISHRSKAFMQVAAEAEQDLRDLLSIPDNYKVLFLQGGASAQFSFVPMNLTAPHSTADYVNTGHWSHKAIDEAAATRKTVRLAEAQIPVRDAVRGAGRAELMAAVDRLRIVVDRKQRESAQRALHAIAAYSFDQRIGGGRTSIRESVGAV